MTSTLVKVPFVDLNLQHQEIQSEIEEAIAKVIERGDFVLGETLAEFEDSFASACEVKYGVGVGSGTDAIAIGLRACGIGVRDEVIVPANTFIATIIGIIQTGATPVLVDCDRHTALIDLEAAAKVVTPKTKAIIPVHLYGQMVSPSRLLDFARTHNLLILEDAAQGHLAYREGYRAGSLGIAAGFSFYPSKNLGAFGDGGMLVTNNEEIANKARILRNYGAKRKYFHTELGKNSRLDTVQAAVLNVKLSYLSEWNRSRNQAAQQYDRLLERLKPQGINPIENQSGAGHIYHIYVIEVGTSINRDEIREKLALSGIQTGIHYPVPCHLQPAYEYLNYKKGDFPNTEASCDRIISLPVYPGLTNSQIDFVCDRLQAIINSSVLH